MDTSSGVTGSCLPVFGKKAGEACYMDADCETGYVCQDSVCMVPAPGDGQFGEFCHFTAARELLLNQLKHRELIDFFV